MQIVLKKLLGVNVENAQLVASRDAECARSVAMPSQPRRASVYGLSSSGVLSMLMYCAGTALPVLGVKHIGSQSGMC